MKYYSLLEPEQSHKQVKSIICRKPALVAPEGNAFTVSQQLEQVMKEKHNTFTKARAPDQMWPQGSLQQAIRNAPLDRSMSVEEMNAQVIAEKKRQINFNPFVETGRWGWSV